MGNVSFAKRFGRQIAERDGGWHCHYCGAELVPIDEMRKYAYQRTYYVHVDSTPMDWDERDLARGFVVEMHGEFYFRMTATDYRFPEHLSVATVDHKIPRAKGGTNELENLVLACKPCNARKRDRYTYEEFRALSRHTACQWRL